MKLLLTTGLLCVALSGCGQRGPLYFPESPASRQPAPAASPAETPARADTEEDADETPAP